jgi:gamma-glutamylcyclotransferase (GGCT)/AIG2-like uncharacterized protein YtfP
LIACENGIACHGELWQVDAAALARLDDYEGAPHYYRREPVAIDGHTEAVFAYFCVKPLPSTLARSDRWPAHP